MPTISDNTTTHPDYQKLLPLWERMRDTIAGQDAIKEKTTLYLPPLNPDDLTNQTNTNQDQTTSYQIYLDNAAYYNAVGLTYEAFLGMIFRKPVRVEKEGDASNETLMDDPLLKNVDFEGSSIEVFSYDIAQEVASVGRVGILYDAPSVEEAQELSINEAVVAGVRPYLKMYTAENIINWKFKSINGVRKLVTVVLQEDVEDEDDPFSHDTVKQYRALLIEDGKYVQRVFNAEGAEDLEQANTTLLLNGAAFTEIPFVCINSSSIGLDVEKPPLLDLANTNLTHYRVSASLGACIHMFGRITPVFYIPQQFQKEFSEQTIEYGVGKHIVIPTDAQGAKAEAGFLEPKADITVVVNEMQRLEARMAAQGARALRPQKSGVESAETVGMDMMSELSILGAIANNTSIGLTMAVSWLMGITTDDMTLVKLNTDFLTKPIDAAMVGQLMLAVKEGRMSQEQFTDAMIRGEAVIPEAQITTDTDFTAEEVEVVEDPQIGNQTQNKEDEDEDEDE